MFDSTIFYKIHAKVLDKMIRDENINESEIREGVRIMACLYAPNPESLLTETLNLPNYNLPSHRCAYLHKYAAFHSALVYDMMLLILEEESSIFENHINTGNFNLCCLGGGPGCDVVGVLTALNEAFCNFTMDVTIVDIMKWWKLTFASVVKELKCGKYGSLRNFVRNSFVWNYVEANLLYSMTNPVNQAIGDADLITMVKFVSSAACQDTEDMLIRIFDSMKVGAMVLFIDNAAGGFYETVQAAANQCKLITKFGPLQHFLYTKEDLKVVRFGFASCSESRVVVQLLQKTNRNKKFDNQRNAPNIISSLNANVNVCHPSASQNYKVNNFNKKSNAGQGKRKKYKKRRGDSYTPVTPSSGDDDDDDEIACSCCGIS